MMFIILLSRVISFCSNTPVHCKILQYSLITIRSITNYSYSSQWISITASGITPMPACRVDPSSTRLSAINFPILYCTSSCSAHHTTQQNTPGRMDSEWDDPRDHLVQMTDVHQTISRATRHLRVDLGNHDISTSSSILTPNVQNPCLLHYEHTLIVLDVPCSHSLQQHPRCHPNDPLSLISHKDQVQNHQIAIFSRRFS